MKFEAQPLPRKYIEGFRSITTYLDTHLESLYASPENHYWYKEDGSPVGNLDHAIESYAHELTSTYLPEFSLIGEESPIPKLSSGNYVVIDPVDGTENFVSGLPIWGCGLALVFDNYLSASWVVFPEINLTFSSKALGQAGIKGRKEFRLPQGISRIKAYSSNTEWSAVAPCMEGEIRVLGSSLFNLTLASLGSISFNASEAGAKVWDILPPILFALEAGKSVTVNGGEYHGEFLDPDKRYVVSIQE